MKPAPKRNLLGLSVYDAGNAVTHQSLAEGEWREPQTGQHQLAVRLCDLLHGYEFHKNGILHDEVCTKPFVEPDPVKLKGMGTWRASRRSQASKLRAGTASYTVSNNSGPVS